MEDSLKKRLIGAAVLASLAVIFVPMLFEEPPSRPPELPPLPQQPPPRDFASTMLREEVPAVTPLAPRPEPTETTGTSGSTPAEPVVPKAGLSAWVVQVGSFSSRENAEKLVGKLREAALPTPDPELVDIRGKRYYRVKVGPVIERAEADAMVDRVNAVSGVKSQVKSYP